MFDLNSLNELGKTDTMRGLPSILSLFHNEFNRFDNTRGVQYVMKTAQYIPKFYIYTLHNYFH